ncbi:hypothetical protein LOH54_10570 [Sulfurimonas sp. HSL-3221]|uniref:hypothetical protein n=1 Tax=Sulfurimonadaceae TaxID=2771471 RepID=UPI001E3ED65F|nr:hypothetical protein [Sulfurimonas sp. HSL-3221]UFS62090.1 hypothetical protein LOH54_10570 [Sulfurimonas sp. HSL-3221]
MLFFLPQTLSAVITGVPGDCSSVTDTAVFDQSNLSYTNSTYVGGDSEKWDYYYFSVDIPGELTITLETNASLDLLYSESSCTTMTEITSPYSISYLNPTDLMVKVESGSANQKDYILKVTFVPAPLSLVKTNVPGQILQNSSTNIDYSLMGVNNQAFDSGSITITDQLPSEANLSTFNIINDGGCTCTAPDATRTFSCSCPALAAGDYTIVDFNVTLSAGAAPDTITNNASMTDGIQSAVTSSTVDVVDGKGVVELKVEKYAEAEAIPVDTDFSYYIFITNYDNAYAYGVQIWDQMDPNIYYTGYDTSSGWICTPPNSPAVKGDSFTCSYVGTDGTGAMGKGIVYLKINARTASALDTGVTADVNVSTWNNVDLDAANTLHNNSITHASREVNITLNDVAPGGGAIGGVYMKGGLVEISENDLSGGRSTAELRTKVAAQIGRASASYATGEMHVPTYFLNGSSDSATPTAYNPTTAAGSNPIPLTVIIRLANDACEEASQTYVTYTSDPAVSGAPLSALFEPGDTSPRYAGTSTEGIPGDFKLRNIALKKARYIMKYVDINAKIADSDEKCTQTSTTQSNIMGLPQCMNSGGSTSLDNNKYLNVFGTSAFVRCFGQNGSPCDSNNHGYSCGEGNTNCIGYNAEYDHEYGCYECTVGGLGYCTQDNFAIRPKAFDSNITTLVSGGDPVKAGLDYALAFKGLTGNTADPSEATLLYNEIEDTLTDGTTFQIDLNISDPTKVCPQTNINMTPAVHFVDGVDSGLFRFDNVGDINFSIHETNGTEFAKVDVNDTPWSDRRIEPFNLSFRIIPDHFEVNATLDDYGDDYTYLYDMNLYDDYNVSTATLMLDIKTMGADNNVTSNYMETCYAKETNVTLQMHSTQIKPAGAVTEFLYYNPAENNGTANSGEGSYTLPGGTLTSVLLENTTTSFPDDAVDGNGTTHIEYRLNFNRKVNKPVDPVRIALNSVYVNDSEPSPYTVTGSHTSTDTATFLYGRGHAPRYRVNCGTVVTGPCLSQNLELFFEFYADNDSNLTLRRGYAQDNERSKDAIMWFRNTKHDSGADGNVTHLSHKFFGYDLNSSTSPLYQGTSITAPGNGISNVRIGYRGSDGYPYKASVNLHTDRWLKYDRFNANPDVNASFLIEFNAIGVEAGEGNLDGTDSGPANSNRRIRW